MNYSIWGTGFTQWFFHVYSCAGQTEAVPKMSSQNSLPCRPPNAWAALHNANTSAAEHKFGSCFAVNPVQCSRVTMRRKTAPWPEAVAWPEAAPWPEGAPGPEAEPGPKAAPGREAAPWREAAPQPKAASRPQPFLDRARLEIALAAGPPETELEDAPPGTGLTTPDAWPMIDVPFVQGG